MRSDSERKYENWLSGRGPDLRVFTSAIEATDAPEIEVPSLSPPPSSPYRVVDLFSGCGGLSLGFDLLGDSNWFRTVMALDIEESPIRVLNQNSSIVNGGKFDPGLVSDLTEFGNEAEFLAYYIQHLAVVENDVELAASLNSIEGEMFPKFLREVSVIDATFIRELKDVRSSGAWNEAIDRLDRSSLQQTSVVGFHRNLRLPRPSVRTPNLGRLLWRQPAPSGSIGRLPEVAHAMICEFEAKWDEEVDVLRSKTEGDGPGQLRSSARRIASFVGFADSAPMTQLRRSWAMWQARRTIARSKIFDDPSFEAGLRSLYETRCKVSVLVGGPPCQGFSRIGRGKIRSLLDVRVHVQGDEEAGDARNLLFQQYIMVLDALRPRVFLFENVQHFQSTVRINGVSFQATEVLADAIAGLSDGKVSYEVHSRVIDASEYGVPQARRRFFMAGVRNTEGTLGTKELAASCLNLAAVAATTLETVLNPLPEPILLGRGVDGPSAMQRRVHLKHNPVSSSPFDQWMNQCDREELDVDGVDSHVARAARTDDAELYALMGPGKRWMDYRADNSPTLKRITALLGGLASMPENKLQELLYTIEFDSQEPHTPSSVKKLAEDVDGSLPLRLLMEQIEDRLDTPHHLLKPVYLTKRDGNHGDWLARMDGSRPSKTMVSHMGKDTYGFVHPTSPRTISVREAARIQTFPDWFSFKEASLTDSFKMVGNAVPPMLSHAIANRVANVLHQLGLEEADSGAPFMGAAGLG